MAYSTRYLGWALSQIKSDPCQVPHIGAYWVKVVFSDRGLTVDDDRLLRMQQLRLRYAARLPARIAAMTAALKDLREGEPRPAARAILHHQAHSLAGSASTFGFDALGSRARQLDQTLRLLGEQDVSDREVAEAVFDLVGDLASLSALSPESPLELFSPLEVAPSPHDPLAFVVDDDDALAQEIATRLRSYGYPVAAFSDAAAVEAALQTLTPDAILVDLDLGAGPHEGPTLAKRVMELVGSAVPLLFFSVHEGWEVRLAAFRAGAAAYVTKPLDFPNLIDTLDSITGRREPKPYRVMILDDVEELALHHADVLQLAGMDARAFVRPFDALEGLAGFRPDLILVDLHMPQMTGIEFAGVIRQKSSYNGMPIIFLSNEHSVDDQLAALKVGGDEFLLKPIRDDHLVAAVSIRAERFRTLNALMSVDGLTGLLTQITTKLQLEDLLPLALRRREALCFAMIDVDHFKQVNDRWGHPAGDRVLRMLARVLKQGVRRSDIVGRFGGEEFAIIFPDTTLEAATILVDRLREKFSNLVQQHGDQQFRVSFSAGLASSGDHPMMDALLCGADRALYRAKAEGRNRVLVDQDAGSGGRGSAVALAPSGRSLCGFTP